MALDDGPGYECHADPPDSAAGVLVALAALEAAEASEPGLRSSGRQVVAGVVGLPDELPEILARWEYLFARQVPRSLYHSLVRLGATAEMVETYPGVLPGAARYEVPPYQQRSGSRE